MTIEIFQIIWRTVFLPNLFWMIPVLVLFILLTAPLPGRGPASRRRDPWRSFKFGVRRELMARAGDRCEAAEFVAWGRCSSPATDADHVYPWSMGGPTVLSNGQALCRAHNTSKSSMTPAWWYLRGLERRRAQYFPGGADVRVIAQMSDEERLSRRQPKRGSRRS
ncbi:MULTISPECIES: HNH endonuclease signature motif containing protein [unclassified Leucobacter]|uniref:HNH endonuclease n=1 Tax=unclassified Leucobacter TaxID=2621730 RepID=UPI00165E7F0F|nr:HNH endonuclease [Leucobacter sp. cx-87]